MGGGQQEEFGLSPLSSPTPDFSFPKEDWTDLTPPQETLVPDTLSRKMLIARSLGASGRTL